MTNERLSFNYFSFLALFSLGIFVGLIFPDTDQGFQTLLGHRSIITHSILLPYLLFSYFKKKDNLTPLKQIFIIGIYLGIALHLSADLHPKGWRGYALIKLPLNIDIGELSPIWISINAVFASFFAAHYLNILTTEKKHWITYFVFCLVVGAIYSSEERYNEEEIFWTFAFLIILTFAYSKYKLKGNQPKKIKNKKDKNIKTKKKGRFWLYAICIPLGLIIIIMFLGSV